MRINHLWIVRDALGLPEALLERVHASLAVDLAERIAPLAPRATVRAYRCGGLELPLLCCPVARVHGRFPFRVCVRLGWVGCLLRGAVARYPHQEAAAIGLPLPRILQRRPNHPRWKPGSDMHVPRVPPRGLRPRGPSLHGL